MPFPGPKTELDEGRYATCYEHVDESRRQKECRELVWMAGQNSRLRLQALYQSLLLKIKREKLILRVVLFFQLPAEVWRKM